MGAKGSTALLQSEAVNDEVVETFDHDITEEYESAGPIRRFALQHLYNSEHVSTVECPEEQEISVLVAKLGKQLGLPPNWIELSSGNFRLPGPLAPPSLRSMPRCAMFEKCSMCPLSRG